MCIYINISIICVCMNVASCGGSGLLESAVTVYGIGFMWNARANCFALSNHSGSKSASREKNPGTQKNFKNQPNSSPKQKTISVAN